MRATKLAAIILLSALLIPGGNLQAEENEISLEEVLELARTYQPLLREHEARGEHARWQQYRAERAYWPSVTAQTLLAPVPAEADPSRIDENLDEILALNLGPYFRQTIRLTMPVYTFGRISRARELANLGVEVSHFQREAALLDHLLQTRRAYYGRQMARSFGELLEEGDRLVKEALEQMEEDRAFGEADFDVEDLRRLQIFNAELDVMLLDNGRLRDLTEAALRYLTDQDRAFQVSPFRVDEADRPLGALEEYLEVAREHRPELKQLAGAVEARRLQEELARREFYPNFFLALDFGYGWSTEDPAFQRVCRQVDPDGPCVDSETLFTRPYSNPFDTLTFGVALGMQWRFDFAQQYGRMREAGAQRKQVESQEERALGALLLEIEEKWRTASDARRRIEIEGRRLDAARRWRNQYGLQQELTGSGNMSEVIAPLRAYYEARVAHLEAAHAYLVARAELARALGVEELASPEAPSN